MTAVGRVRLTRQYVVTPAAGQFPADAVPGVAGYVTRAAERMAVLAGARDSFARAAVALRELSGWDLDDEVIRRLTHAAAGRIGAARGDRADGPRFAAAGGVIEAQIDAGQVNTTAGWRDVKLGVFCERPPGDAAAPEQWGDRDLPAPATRAVVAHVEGAGAFAARVRAEADRPGVTTAGGVTVLGDGAEWIWNLAADVLPQAGGVLDVYHAVEHVAGAVRAIWGEAEAAAAQREAGRAALLAGGKAGIERWTGGAFAGLPAGAGGDELRDSAAYFAARPTRLGYRERLAAGRSIGSGPAEGSVKQLVNRRLKLTGARWRVEHAGPLVELAALIDTPDWHAVGTAA